MTDVTSLDSGFDAPDGVAGLSQPAEPGVHIRVTMPEDPSFQIILIARPLDLVWTLKRKVLDNITQSLKDPMNYGLYCPPSNMRVGKYLDEERPIKEYPLSIPIGLLEFKYKRKLYKTEINPLKLKKMHVPTELKAFLDQVTQGKVDEIRAKLNRGFDPNFNSVNKGETPLTLAATLPRPGALVLALVGGGAFVDFRNRKGLTPLHVATIAGNKDAVRILLDLGSSPNYKDADGLTPLCYATRKDTPALCVQWLLQERADIGRRDKRGWMEIHCACEHGLVQHLEHLLYYGADRNAQTTDSNDTPLHICARFNQGECARLLLMRGADKSLKNKLDQDAAQVAVTSGHEEVAKIISDFRPEQVELFNDIPKYNEKRRGTISVATLRNLQRSRSNPNLLQQLFQQDPVLSATVSQVTAVQYLSSGLIPNGNRSPGRPSASNLFPTGANGVSKTESSTPNHVERIIELHRGAAGFGFVLRGPLDPPGSILNFLPTPDIPARQYIESVDPDSVAEKAGLQAGDFILEINGQSVIFSSHKDCVKLMKSGGDSLRLKVIRVQRPGSLKKQPQQSHVDAAVVDAPSEDTMIKNSLTSTSAAQFKTSLTGLEALENLDAALDSFEQTATNSIEDEIDASVAPPPPMEFSSESASVDDVILISPPPPSYDDPIETTESEFTVPAPVLNEEVVAVLYAKDRVPNGETSVLIEPRPRVSVLSEPDPDYEEAVNEVEPSGGKGAVVVVVSGMVNVESPNEKVTVDLTDEGVSIEPPEKKIPVESAQHKVPDEHNENGSGEKFNIGTSGKRAVSLAYAISNEENKKLVDIQSKKTEVTSNRKSYAAAPPPPPPPEQLKTTPSPAVAAAKVSVVSVATASIKDEEQDRATSNNNHSGVVVVSTSPLKIPPAPPAPPPPSFGTLSRSTAPLPLDGDKSPTVPKGAQKHLDESRNRDDSHAALMAAILKRKNVLDSTDGDHLAESIDARIGHTRQLQKIVYRADNTKEVKSPPVAATGLLAPAEGTLPRSSPTGEDDSPGFRAEAEKMRQAFLLQKSVSKEAPKSPETIAATGWKNPTDAVKASPTNGTLPSKDTKTSENRTLSRPKSTAVNSQPVLADVAFIIAQKALARQKKDETELKISEVKLKVTEASPKSSSVVAEDKEKATISDRKTIFESGTLKPAVPATLPKNSTSKVYSSENATIIGPNSPMVVKSQPPTVTSQQTKFYGASVTSTDPQIKSISANSKSTSSGARLSDGKPSNRNSSSVAAPMANVPHNQNTTVYASSPPVAAETSVSLMKSSREVKTLPRTVDATAAKANSAQPSVEVPLFIPPPVEFATPQEAGFTTEVYATATLRSTSKSTQSNSMVFRAKSSITSDPVPSKTFCNQSISAWNENDVGEWLESFNYSDYRPLFAEKGITGRALAQLKPDEMEAMGIKNLLHRNRIEREIRIAVAKK